MVLFRPLGTNFSEISIEIHRFLFKKMHLGMSSAKCRQFCLELHVLMIEMFPSNLTTKNWNTVFLNSLSVLCPRFYDLVVTLEWHLQVQLWLDFWCNICMEPTLYDFNLFRRGSLHICIATYRQTSNIRRTLVFLSDVVGNINLTLLNPDRRMYVDMIIESRKHFDSGH